VSASPAFNQVFYTSAAPDQVLASLAASRAPGWKTRQGAANSIIWTHRYSTTAVLIVGIVLLVTTLIGGILLLAKSEESLIVSVTMEGGLTKVIASGSADANMSASIFSVVNSFPSIMPGTTAFAPAWSPAAFGAR
jgi:hypothetical protein